VHLIDDHEARSHQPVQLAGVGSEYAQMPPEHPGLRRVRAPAELQVPVDDVGVVEDACERRGGLVQDRGLLAAGGCAVDRGVLDRQQVIESDRREQRGLAVASADQHDRLALRSRDRGGDPLLERLELQSDQIAELLETPTVRG
jgi:hypothetical protein